MTGRAEEIVGTWKSDRSDAAGLELYGDVTLEFSGDGSLTYTIHSAGRDEVILLTFRVENSFIITDQPSAPRLERTAYDFLRDGRLVLVSDRGKAHFVRLA